jgi:hypothetical protein
MKDATLSDAVLNVLRGTTLSGITTLYLALCGSATGDSDYDPKDRATWTEITTTDCPTYSRPVIVLGAPAAGTGGDAGYRVATGSTIAGSAAQYPFPAFNKAMTVDGAVLCSHASNALSTCGLRGVDAKLAQSYASGAQAAVTPANVKVKEQ